MIGKAIEELPEGAVLVAPLNWGLGHATRCIPIIRALIADKRRVVVAAEGGTLSLLREEFPECRFLIFKGIKVKYSKSKSQIWAMLRQLPGFIIAIRREHRDIREIVEKENIAVVISDNRFGLFGSRAYTVYITHQLMIKMPKGVRFAERIVWRIHRMIIDRYDKCWIPDTEEDGLSGDLAHKYPLPPNGEFVGILSRFSLENATKNIAATKTEITEKFPFLPQRTDYLVLISGPEPHRTIMENEIKLRFKSGDLRDRNALILEGRPEKDGRIGHQTDGNIITVNHLPSHILEYYLMAENSRHIICRSGYSTLMDLAVMHRKADILLPTTGQTEQEYLATVCHNGQSASLPSDLGFGHLRK